MGGENSLGLELFFNKNTIFNRLYIFLGGAEKTQKGL